MFAVDLHAHTHFFHGRPDLGRSLDSYGAALADLVARSRKLDAIAFTNHDYSYYEDHPTHGSVVHLPGIEVSTSMGHVTVVGPDPPRRTRPGEYTPAELVDEAHERDCIAILAHPFRGSSARESGADFDAVEINGKHPRTAERVRELADELDLPLIAGSDAHYPVEIGRAYTMVDAPELSPESVVEAVRDGRVEPRVTRDVGDYLVRRLYKLVHSAKGVEPTATAEWERKNRRRG